MDTAGRVERYTRKYGKKESPAPASAPQSR